MTPVGDTGGGPAPWTDFFTFYLFFFDFSLLFELLRFFFRKGGRTTFSERLLPVSSL